MATPRPAEQTRSVLLQVAENEQASSDTRRRNRKYRYRKQGYHKTERDNARRTEARNFLSGITLDSHYRVSVETQEQTPPLFHESSKHSGLTTEDVLLSNVELPQADEMPSLYELYSNHSPVKVPTSRSQTQDIGFDYVIHTHHLVNRSASLHESVSSPTPEPRKMHHIAHTKSLGSSIECGDIRYFGRGREFPIDSRYIP